MMNKRIEELALLCYEECGDYHIGSNSQFNHQKFAELIVAEAFRAGMLYSAKKYADEGSEHFTGNDVAMFLEMEACELSDEDIKEHFGVEE
jgi:hypothetical protein